MPIIHAIPLDRFIPTSRVYEGRPSWSFLLPPGSKPIRLATVNGSPTLWIESSPDARFGQTPDWRDTETSLRLVCNGDPYTDDWEYWGTIDATVNGRELHLIARTVPTLGD